MFSSPARSIARCFVLSILLPVLLFCCTAPVTSGGAPVTNDTLATAARAVHVAELAMVTAADALTAGYKSGAIHAAVLEKFQSQVAPRIAAALATAKVALKTAHEAPGATPMETVIRAVIALQGEVTALQGWWGQNAFIIQGATK